jgi:uncharacterized protein (TIGR01777 family)
MNTLKKIVIAGGTGQVGAILARAFHAQGCDVVVLGRKPIEVPWRFVEWDAKSLGAWCSEIEGADAVINLAGRSVNCRYSVENRRLITDSRVDSARVIGEAIRKASNPPPVWLQMSTATIYAHRYDAPNDEATGILGGDEPNVPETWRFSIDVAKAWENAAIFAQPPWTRLVLLRTAMVMSPDPGGVFATLSRLVKLGLGGRHGNGRQFMSWIHEEDFVRAIEMILENDSINGPINLCSPNPLPDVEFMAALREAWGIPLGLPATNWMLEVGAFFLRTETELILKSRRVIPGLLLNLGFEFRFPHWHVAAGNLIHQRQSQLFPSKPTTPPIRIANETKTFRISTIADILRYIQIVALLPFGLIGFFALALLSQRMFEPSQLIGAVIAIYCIVFGWALLIGLIAMEWLSTGWRIFGWIVILIHNVFILNLSVWPYHPKPTLIPDCVLVLSGISLFFEMIGAFEKRPSTKAST